MGFTSLASLMLQLEKRSKEFKAQNNKDEYIKFLEDANKQILKEYGDLYQEYTEIISNLEDKSSNTLNAYHLELLRIANLDEEDGITTYHLEKLYKENGKYQIAFSQLLDWDYLELTHSYGAALINSKTVHCYCICYDKKTDVLIKLSDAGKL